MVAKIYSKNGILAKIENKKTVVTGLRYHLVTTVCFTDV